MATKRMTANDYQKELHKLELDRLALEKRIRARANEMCEQNPDVVIGEMKINTGKGVVTTKDYINKLEDVQLSTVFTVMEIIEEDLKAKHPHKQTEINFSDKECISSKSPDGKHHYEHGSKYCGFCHLNKNYF